MSKQRRVLDIANRTTSEIITNSLFEFIREDLLVCIPAIITDIGDYESSQCVSVQPVVDDIYEDGVVIQSPVLNKVFVQLQSAGGFSIKLPVAVGDKCVVHWSHRDMTHWLNGDGDKVEVDISLLNKREDCYVTLGYGTRSNHQNPSQTDLIIEGENTTITIKPSGEITTETNGKVTLKTPEYYVDTPTTTFTGDVQINGSANVSAKVTSPTVEASSSLKASGAEVVAHNHNNNVPPLA